MVLILSFDVGIKNLAYCLFRLSSETSELDFDIIEWSVLNIHTEDDKHFDSKSTQLFQILNDTFGKHIESLDYVAIENQPVLKNPIMKSVQMMLYSYFKLYQIHLHPNGKSQSLQLVEFVNASCKVKYATTDLCKRPGFISPEINENLPKYRKTKECSILYTKELLRVLNKHSHLEYFNQFKKKDDLADTLLQGLYFVHKHKLLHR